MRLLPLGIAFLSTAIPLAASRTGFSSEEKQSGNTPTTQIGKEDLRHDVEASRKGIENLCFFWGAKDNSLEGYIQGSSRQITRSVLYVGQNEKYLRGVLTDGGLKGVQIIEMIKRFKDEVKRFNEFSLTKGAFTVDLTHNERKTLKEPILNPKISPSKTLEKYELAKYGFPILLVQERDKRIDVDSISFRRYIDPLDGKIKKGIHVREEDLQEQFTGKPAKTEDERTILLVPEYCSVAIVTKYNVLVVAKPGIVDINLLRSAN